MSEVKDKSDEQVDAEADVEGFKDDLGPFVVAAETTRMAMVFTDAKGAGNPIIFANESFLKLTGFDRDEVLGQSFNFLMEKGTDAETVARIKAEFDETSDHDLEVCYRRKDDSHFWAGIFINPVRDEKGDIVQHFASFVDVTRHKEENARSSTLIDELNHRVKNTLSTVQSIIVQSARKNPDPEAVRAAIESRVFALARSHDLLTKEEWQPTGLRDLIKAALVPFGVEDAGTGRLVIEGNNIRVPPKASLALGIAFHELATNAMKYGALSNETGQVLVSWSMGPPPANDRLVLHWQEKGGPPVAPPTHKGFGARVIERGLASELDGTVRLDYLPEGVVCMMNVPAP